MALVDRDILRWSSGEQERVSGGVVLHLLNLNRLTAGIVMAVSMPVEEGDPLWLTLAEDDAIEECEKERSGFPHPETRAFQLDSISATPHYVKISICIVYRILPVVFPC